VDGHGSPHPEGSVPSGALTRAAHAAGVRVLLSFGGSESGGRYNAFTKSEVKRKTFVTAAMKLLEDFGYDGLDNDWEFPENEADRANYGRLNRELRVAMNRLEKRLKRKLLLTAALPSGEWAGKWYPTVDLVTTYDFVNVMTYDFAGEWGGIAGHNAPLDKSSRDPEGGSIKDAMAYWVKRGIPRDHLNLGLANYGRGFDVALPYMKVATDARSKVSELDYRDAVKLLAQGWTRSVDGEAGVPWLYAPDHSAVFGYDDPESQAKKIVWGKSEGFGGIFFWDINADRMPDGSHPLVDAAIVELHR
jgi:chitinase